MKRTYQPNRRKRKKTMALEKECQLPLEEEF